MDMRSELVAAVADTVVWDAQASQPARQLAPEMLARLAALANDETSADAVLQAASSPADLGESAAQVIASSSTWARWLFVSSSAAPDDPFVEWLEGDVVAGDEVVDTVLRSGLAPLVKLHVWEWMFSHPGSQLRSPEVVCRFLENRDQLLDADKLGVVAAVFCELAAEDRTLLDDPSPEVVAGVVEATVRSGVPGWVLGLDVEVLVDVFGGLDELAAPLFAEALAAASTDDPDRTEELAAELFDEDFHVEATRLRLEVPAAASCCVECVPQLPVLLVAAASADPTERSQALSFLGSLVSSPFSTPSGCGWVAAELVSAALVANSELTAVEARGLVEAQRSARFGVLRGVALAFHEWDPEVAAVLAQALGPDAVALQRLRVGSAPGYADAVLRCGDPQLVVEALAAGVLDVSRLLEFPVEVFAERGPVPCPFEVVAALLAVLDDTGVPFGLFAELASEGLTVGDVVASARAAVM